MVIKPPYQGNFICFPLKKAHFFTLPLPFTTSLRNSWEQPPYSPEVNPVEHIWDELREKYFHNRVFPSLEPLIDVLCQGLNDLADDSKRLRSLTGFPHLNITL